MFVQGRDVQSELSLCLYVGKYSVVDGLIVLCVGAAGRRDVEIEKPSLERTARLRVTKNEVVRVWEIVHDNGGSQP